MTVRNEHGWIERNSPDRTLKRGTRQEARYVDNTWEAAYGDSPCGEPPLGSITAQCLIIALQVSGEPAPLATTL